MADQWSCGQCTLLNLNSSTNCSACDAPRTTGVAATAQWACPACTFLNEPWIVQCSICARAKPAPPGGGGGGRGGGRGIVPVNQPVVIPRQTNTPTTTQDTEDAPLPNTTQQPEQPPPPEPELTNEEIEELVKKQKEELKDTPIAWWQWACIKCTYINDKDDVKCKICRTIKPFKPVNVDIDDDKDVSMENKDGQALLTDEKTDTLMSDSSSSSNSSSSSSSSDSSSSSSSDSSSPSLPLSFSDSSSASSDSSSMSSSDSSEIPSPVKRNKRKEISDSHMDSNGPEQAKSMRTNETAVETTS